MLGSGVLLGLGGGGLLLLGVGLLYGRYLHPAWRKERRLRRACAKAFDAEAYLLERLHLRRRSPSVVDFLSPLDRLPDPLPYFTYNVEVAEGERPDFSATTSREKRLVRRYLHSSGALPHYTREVLHPEGRSAPATRKGRLGSGG